MMRLLIYFLQFVYRYPYISVCKNCNTIGQKWLSYASVATMPFVLLPVEDVPLLSYALAHKTVNSGYTMTASNDDIYMGLMNGDPYTSTEQKQRDLYEVNDTDWSSVRFEQVEGTSVCHLALHTDWIQSRGYTVDAIVDMNLSEQGISGLFRITSIKHILPQKKPESDPGDEYEWKFVTGLFIHNSDQIYTITFDGKDTLGVTAPHPIFSTTRNDWRLAIELEVEERVRAYHGDVTVTSNENKVGSDLVYNLEVKDLHNFLVGDVGIVVHNACPFPKDKKELAKLLGMAWWVHDWVKDVISAYRKDFPYRVGKNPDVGLGPTGKLAFKVTENGPHKGKIWEHPTVNFADLIE